MAKGFSKRPQPRRGTSRSYRSGRSRRPALLQLHAREHSEHGLLRGGVEDAVSSKILSLRVFGGAYALGRFREIVRRVPKLKLRAQQKPMGKRLAKRHSHTPGVHDSSRSHLPVELHVGMATDDQSRAQSRENRQEPGLRRQASETLILVSRCRVTEEHFS